MKGSDLARTILWVIAGVLIAGVISRVLVGLLAAGPVTSWWRSPWKNRAVGGKANSRHQFGLAFDVAAKAGDRQALRALSVIWPFTQVVDEGDHLHVELV